MSNEGALSAQIKGLLTQTMTKNFFILCRKILLSKDLEIPLFKKSGDSLFVKRGGRVEDSDGGFSLRR
jgi:hypothetical protein